jgi:hypothetical protein
MTHSPDTPKSTYQVGYGKPPKHTQFQPGQTGNPNGRPRGAPTADEILRREAARLTKIESGGKVETVTRLEVVIRQLLKIAASGDLRAIGLVLANCTRINGAGGDAAGNAQEEATVDLAIPDDETVQRMLQRFAHLLPKPGAPNAAE